MINKKKALAAIWDFFETIIVSLVIFLICYLWLFQPHKVQGLSMFPTFDTGDYILTNKIKYRFSEPEIGQIVVFAAPDHPEYDYIKRIIAKAGDRVKLINGNVYVNGYIIDESEYLPENMETHGERFMTDGQEVIVPPNTYFVAGDNRPNSSDSRDFGPVSYDDIVGMAWFRYWPITDLGLIKQANK